LKHEKEYRAELAELEKKYLKIYQPLFEKVLIPFNNENIVENHVYLSNNIKLIKFIIIKI